MSFKFIAMYKFIASAGEFQKTIRSIIKSKYQPWLLLTIVFYNILIVLKYLFLMYHILLLYHGSQSVKWYSLVGLVLSSGLIMSSSSYMYVEAAYLFVFLLFIYVYADFLCVFVVSMCIYLHIQQLIWSG